MYLKSELQRLTTNIRRVKHVQWKVAVVCFVLFMSLFQFKDTADFLEQLRDLSIDLGGGRCKWTPPAYTMPANVTYDKLLLVGFPGGDKRLVYVQMEALTGLTTHDEWFYDKASNRPYVKSNYPHHEGTWGWGKTANQVILVVRSIRKSLPEYHDVLADINYATSPYEALKNQDNLYKTRSSLESFLAWRDARASAEIQWYGWFIDYWMEGGLYRDIMTHKLTTKAHWERSMQPSEYTESALAYEEFVGDLEVPMAYDPHCLYDMPNGCEPILVVSGDRLIDLIDGPSEIEKVGTALEGRKNVDVISKEARTCIWNEIVVKRKGTRTLLDRGGMPTSEYGFTANHLQEMIDELTRLRDKYSSPGWSFKETAQDLVSILNQDIQNVELELTDTIQQNLDRSRGYQWRHLKRNEEKLRRKKAEKKESKE